MDHSETAPHLTLGWHSTAGGGGLAYGAHDGMMYIWDVQGVLYSVGVWYTGPLTGTPSR